ncbi:PRC-barrel domain-containing protein [Pseudonocardia hispaniensis]|uniref:PRC-barrel domain-containing protein n=1 Tax=Pseudonocardia hispaniensis TaxID=904933 RepID=A0ABW1J438_9PSEU
MSLRRLLGCAVVGEHGAHLGHVRDVVVHRSPDPAAAVVSGLVADIGGVPFFVSAQAVAGWQAARVRLRSAPVERRFVPRPDALLLARGVLGRLVVTPTSRRPTRIRDLTLRRRGAHWVVWAADTRGAIARLLRAPSPVEWNALVQRRLLGTE